MRPGTPTRAIAIGASAGAVEALLVILPALPIDTPSVLVTVHIPPDRTNTLVPLLQARCAVRIKEAEDKETAQAGTVYFAPPDYHLLVERDGSLALSSDELVNYSRPSIDVLFETAADAWGSGLIGVILTGANHDGARGLQAVARCGGDAVVQDPRSAVAATMPEAALAACPDARILPLTAIIHHLIDRNAG